MAITTNQSQRQKQKSDDDTHANSSRDQGQRPTKDHRTNQNTKINWGRDQEGNTKPNKLYSVFHGEDKGHTQKIVQKQKKPSKE